MLLGILDCHMYSIKSSLEVAQRPVATELSGLTCWKRKSSLMLAYVQQRDPGNSEFTLLSCPPRHGLALGLFIWLMIVAEPWK